MNIFEFAMKMELDGKKYYEKLMNEAEDKGLKKIFKMLAEDEKRHHEIIDSLKEEFNINVKSETLKNANNIFAKMLSSQKSCKEDISHIDAYRHAYDLEEKSIKFYEDCLNKATDEKEREVLKKLWEEEKKHKIIIENVIEFVREPLKTWGVKTKDSDPEFARYE